MIDLAEFMLARIAEDEAEIALGFDFATLDSSGWMGHAASWDQERALAECEAKRRIVQLHSGDAEWCAWTQGGMGTHGDMGNGPANCETLRLLALPHADHPDYREEWRP